MFYGTSVLGIMFLAVHTKTKGALFVNVLEESHSSTYVLATHGFISWNSIWSFLNKYQFKYHVKERGLYLFSFQ